jgi:predicted Fe-S protein YdhL (DUF1289 family)
MTITSPCIDICVMDPDSELCSGCLRALHEIAVWGGLSETDQQVILTKIKARRAELEPPEG